MKIVMVGAGYVGLVSSACFAEFGIDTVCVERDTKRISRLEAGDIPIFEPGLADLVRRNTSAGRLRFLRRIPDGLGDVDAALIAVGTPSRAGDPATDMRDVHAAARGIARALEPEKRRTVVVTKSTVPVGTATALEALIAAERPDLRAGRDFDVASNPEFLREGSAIEDFQRPDRVICGVSSAHAQQVLASLYAPLNLREVPLVFSSRETAELTKYASNAFLAMKVSFINEMADLCETAGADVQELARGLGMDRRIGSKFLHPGPGFGGSCFPKDTRALSAIAAAQGVRSRLVDAVVELNEARKASLTDRIEAAVGGRLQGCRVAILGLTFKQNTDDLRESPSLTVVPELLRRGAEVAAWDPAQTPMMAGCPEFQGMKWAASADEAIRDRDVLVVLTEWNEFRGLDPQWIRAQLRTPLVLDFRNIFRADEMVRAGIRYVSVGRRTLEPD